MGALYAMNYVGQTGIGGGAVYIGDGKILGVDVGNIRYLGTYTVQGTRLRGTIALHAPTGGTLVTGTELPAGSRIDLALDWSANLADGQPQPVVIEGKPTHVVLEKIGDT